MNFENQGVIKRLADQYGPENLTVVLGNGEAKRRRSVAETVTEGDRATPARLPGLRSNPRISCAGRRSDDGGAGQNARGEAASYRLWSSISSRCIRCWKLRERSFEVVQGSSVQSSTGLG